MIMICNNCMARPPASALYGPPIRLATNPVHDPTRTGTCHSDTTPTVLYVS